MQTVNAVQTTQIVPPQMKPSAEGRGSGSRHKTVFECDMRDFVIEYLNAEWHRRGLKPAQMYPRMKVGDSEIVRNCWPWKVSLQKAFIYAEIMGVREGLRKAMRDFL